MNFQIELFANEVREIRKKQRLSQNDVFKMVGINTETLRKIENAQVIPKFETLDLLSSAYKVDICEIFLRYRVKDYKKYIELKKIVESKLTKGEYTTLYEEVNSLNNQISDTQNTLYKNLITQLKLMCEGIIELFVNDNYENSYKLMTKAILITTPNYHKDKLEEFVYSGTEIRILTYMSFYYFKAKDLDMVIRVLTLCHRLEIDDISLRQKIVTNLSSAYMRKKQYDLAIKLCNDAITEGIKYSVYTNLSSLYYNKGCAEFYIDKDNAISSFKKAIVLSDSFGQYTNRNTMLRKCKNIYKLNLDKI